VGVQIYILDRRTASLTVGDHSIQIGIVRRFWKVTEMNGERLAELEAAKAISICSEGPVAVMVADVVEFSDATDPSAEMTAHIVLGWDTDRYSVTDSYWDYLPILGYAVRRSDAMDFELHEEIDGILRPMSKDRAREMGLVDRSGGMIRRGQPEISMCRSVRPFIPSYVQAECVLSDGRVAELLTRIQNEHLPPTTWYIGKKPDFVNEYYAS
jgi:hypothetical protein